MQTYSTHVIECTVYNDKKENQIFLISREIQNSSYMTLQLLHSEFSLYMRKIFFSFLSVYEP